MSVGLFPEEPMARRRPSKKYIEKFTVEQVGDDTVRTYLTCGYSLIIFCKDCPRTIEWTPPELERRYGDRTELRIAAIVSRLKCTGEGGCGSEEVAVGPRLYDQPWSWPARAARGGEPI